MKKHDTGVLTAALLLRCALPLAAQGTAANWRVSVGPNVLVSRARGGDAHYEVLVAAHPTDASRLLVGSMFQPGGAPGASGSIAYVSHDGGDTWTPTLETPPAAFAGSFSGDPAVAYGPDGEAYFVASLLAPGSVAADRRMLLYRSADGGDSWTGPLPFTYSDREYIAVDQSAGARRGRVYVVGNGRVGPGAGSLAGFYSTDGGSTFVDSRVPRLPATPVMGNTVLLSDGTVVALFSAIVERTGAAPGDDAMHALLRIAVSRDGGASFEAPVDIAPVALVSGRKGGHNNTSNLPVLAVDPSSSAYRDRLYVVWPEYKDGHTSIRMSVSRDRGRTWSAPHAVRDAPVQSAADDFMPAIDVNRDGVVGLSWYDRRDRADDLGWDVRFAASFDGGDTFQPSVAVSQHGTTFGADDRWILETRTAQPAGQAGTLEVALNTFTFLGGDTAGLVADAAGTFHPVWVDNSSGIPQVWTAPVRLVRAMADAPPASPYNTGLGSPLIDITSRVTLESFDAQYDRASRTITVRTRLLSASKAPLVGPFALQLSSLQSELGAVSVANADGRAASGGEFYFETAAGGVLSLGERTRTKTLVFHLRDPQPFREGTRYRRGLLNLRFRILGRAEQE